MFIFVIYQVEINSFKLIYILLGVNIRAEKCIQTTNHMLPSTCTAVLNSINSHAPLQKLINNGYTPLLIVFC